MSDRASPKPEVAADSRGDPLECAYCHAKPCLKTAPTTIDVCIYGIAFYNDGINIRKKREDVSMRHIAANLRHELNKVLHYIIAQANIVDIRVSLKHIDLNSPASRIVGATQILDNFIELICGVYEFFPDEGLSSANQAARINLKNTISRLKDTYSLIKNTRRATDLNIDIEVSGDIFIARLPLVVEYLLVVLIDNLWKYSFDKASVAIRTVVLDENIMNIEFTNHGMHIPQAANVFSKGYKLDHASEGFGFGLFWAKILCEYYNRSAGRETDFVDITHTQQALPQILIDEEDLLLPSISKHTFTLHNISYVRAK